MILVTRTLFSVSGGLALTHLMIRSHLVFPAHCNEFLLLIFLCLLLLSSLCLVSLSLSRICVVKRSESVGVPPGTGIGNVSLWPVSSLASFWLHGKNIWQWQRMRMLPAACWCNERLTYKHAYCSMRAKNKTLKHMSGGLKIYFKYSFLCYPCQKAVHSYQIWCFSLFNKSEKWPSWTPPPPFCTSMFSYHKFVVSLPLILPDLEK